MSEGLSSEPEERDDDEPIQAAKEALLGPGLPGEDGVLRITEDQFIERYKPEEDGFGCVFVQRYMSNDEDRPLILDAIDRKCCWTMVEDDNGVPCIEWGNRVVNNLYYVLTQRPIENEAWIIVVAPDEDLVEFLKDRDEDEEGY